jgi:hypothetical protein
MTSRRSFLRSLSLLPLAPGLLSEVAVEAAVAASVPERPTFYYKHMDKKRAELNRKFENAIFYATL